MTAVSKPSPRSTMVSISASEASSSTTRILCLMASMVSPDRDKTRTPHGRFLADTPKYGEISSLSGPDGRFWADLGANQGGGQPARIHVCGDDFPSPEPARRGQAGVLQTGGPLRLIVPFVVAAPPARLGRDPAAGPFTRALGGHREQHLPIRCR